MTLKELLQSGVKLATYRPIDLAKVLNKSPRAVSFTLRRDLDCITVRTLKEYLEATGRQVDFKKLVNTQ